MKSAIKLYTINKVKELRIKHEMSLRYFADCLNISHSYIHCIEDPTSDKAYNLDHLNEIAKLFRCALWELIPQNPL